jgi:hypothetical protein
MAAAYSIGRDVPLAARNTFGLDVQARVFATVHDAAALPALLAEPSLQGQSQMVLGAGSNVLFADSRYDGCLLHLVGSSTRILHDAGDHATVHVDAGCEWDALVDWTLDQGLHAALEGHRVEHALEVDGEPRDVARAGVCSASVGAAAAVAVSAPWLNSPACPVPRSPLPRGPNPPPHCARTSPARSSTAAPTPTWAAASWSSSP